MALWAAIAVYIVVVSISLIAYQFHYRFFVSTKTSHGGKIWVDEYADLLLVPKMRPQRHQNTSTRRNSDKHQNGEILCVGKCDDGFHRTNQEAGNSKIARYFDFIGAWRIFADLHNTDGNL